MPSSCETIKEKRKKKKGGKTNGGKKGRKKTKTKKEETKTWRGGRRRCPRVASRAPSNPVDAGAFRAQSVSEMGRAAVQAASGASSGPPGGFCPKWATGEIPLPGAPGFLFFGLRHVSKRVMIQTHRRMRKNQRTYQTGDVFRPNRTRTGEFLLESKRSIFTSCGATPTKWRNLSAAVLA